MKVPLVDLVQQNSLLEDELQQAFKSILDQGRFILGEPVEQYEKQCAQYLNVQFALGVSSGTDALLLSYMALGLKPGDEVICPSFTFFATAGSLIRLGVKPVFVDICPQCFNLSIEDLKQKINRKTKAIVVVHLFGQSVDMDPVLELSEKYRIPIVEDTAQSMGATYHGVRLGTLGKVGCFSFFPTKNLGGFGDGGLVVTNDEKLYLKMKSLRIHGASEKYIYNSVGGNFRLDSLHAALLSIKLKHLDQYLTDRKKNAETYFQLFNKYKLELISPQNDGNFPVELPQLCHDDHTFNQFVIRVKENQRDDLRSYLHQHEIMCEVYYPMPLHVQECMRTLEYKVGDMPVAENASEEVLALPIYPELKDDQIDFVVKTIYQYFKDLP